jgi:hypothetical protein
MIQIEVVHTDLPSNDFSALFEALDKEPNSYMAGTSGVLAIKPSAPFLMSWRELRLPYISASHRSRK